MNSNTAHTHVTWNYDDALIEVQPWVLGISPAPSPDDSVFASVVDDPLEFERLMVHELLHAFMRRHARAHSKLAEQLPEPLQEAYGVLRGDADEEIVDILAGVLVRLRHGKVEETFDLGVSPLRIPTP